MTTKEKASLEGIATDIKWIKEKLIEDSGRIGCLEKDVSKAKGVVWAIGGLAGFVGTMVGHFIGKK